MSCPTCGGQLPTAVLETIGAFLVVPFAVFAAVLFAVRRTLRALPSPDEVGERPPADSP